MYAKLAMRVENSLCSLDQRQQVRRDWAGGFDLKTWFKILFICYHLFW
jgi:hypothetical protein